MLAPSTRPARVWANIRHNGYYAAGSLYPIVDLSSELDEEGVQYEPIACKFQWKNCNDQRTGWLDNSIVGGATNVYW